MEVTERQHGEERLMPLKEHYYLCFPRARGMSHHVGPHGAAPRRQKGAKGKHRPPFLLCFLYKSKQGRRSSLALSALSNVSQRWAIRAVSGCLVPGSG